MSKKAVLTWIIALLLLAACGGGSEAEPAAPAADNNTSSSTTTETEDQSDESDSSSDEAEVVAEEEVAEEVMEEEVSEESEEIAEESSEEVVEEVQEEAVPASPFGDRAMSGTDAETGLAVNPESVNPGDTFIVRGEIISMNLTPTTSPEFLIQAPDGLKFRIRSQDLADTYFEDGDQLQAFQYQIGLLAQATASLDAGAGPSDIPSSTDLVLIKDE